MNQMQLRTKIYIHFVFPLLLSLNTAYAGHDGSVGSAQTHNLGRAPLQNLTT